MIRNEFKIGLLCLALLSFYLPSNGQIAHLNNSRISDSPTDYVGWDNNATYSLPVHNDANYSIDYYTNGLYRMQVDSLGNVDINTKNKRAVLNVKGQNYITGYGWNDGLMMYNRSAIVFD